MNIIEDLKYWIDSKNNKWDKKLYTKEEAEKYSKSLFNCSECINCIGCINCSFCENCYDCYECVGCRDCKDCYICGDCHNCNNCDNCDSCINCQYSYDLNHCHDYIVNPARYITLEIEGEEGQIYFYYGRTDKDFSLQVHYRDFNGSLGNFIEEIMGRDDEYSKECWEEIEKVKALFNLKGE